MSLFSGHTNDLNEDNLNLDNTEEIWTEPLNTGTNSTLICPDFINKPAVSKIGHSRTIIHFDIDCFYAQVEMLRNPELQDKPLGIQQKNIVVTTNYIARQCGVPKSTYVSDAKKICPNLVLVCGEDLTNYRQMSYRISEFFQKYTPCVERLGFDENFIDASEMVQMRLQNGTYKQEFVGHVYYGNQGTDRSQCRCGCELRLQIGSQIAADIREALHKELGITSCAGIGHNKLLAKVVAGTHKPNQQTTVLPHLALDLLSSFSSVLCIPGIGYRTSHRLNALGISTVADLQAADGRVLVKEFGPQMAQLMNQLSHGVDDSTVVAYSQPQTLSDEDAFKCCKDIADVEQRIKELTSNLLKRVAEDGRIPQTVRLTVRRVPNKHHRETRQCPIPRNIFTKFLQLGGSEDVVDRLMPVLMNLFSRLVDPSKPFHLTLISVCFAKLKPADELRGIGTFFTKAETLSQCAESKLVTDKTTGDQVESKYNSSAELEFKTKPEAKVKTMRHFFSMANTEPHSVSLQKSNTAGRKASQLSQFHRTDSSLPVTDALIDTDVSLTTKASLAVTDVSLATKESFSVTDVTLTMVPAAKTDVPLTTTPLTTLVPQTTKPSATLVSQTTIPSATLVPLTTLPSATLVPQTAIPSATLVPLTAMPSATLVQQTSMPSATTDAPLTAMPQATCELLPETALSLTEIDVCERSLIQGSIKQHTTTTTTLLHTEELSAVLPGNSSDIEVHSLEEDCLQKLLSAGIDVETITELPLDIQNEVLGQYGIYVEDLPQGRRFIHISDKVRTRSGNTPKLATVKTRPVRGKQNKSTKRNLEKSLLDAEVVDRLSKQRKIFCKDNEIANNESLWKVTLTENREDSPGMDALCERYVVKETLSSDVIEDQQHHAEMTFGHSSSVTDEQPRRRNLNTFSLCSNISQLSDKESDCVSIFHLPRKASDGMDVSQFLDKESDCVNTFHLPRKASDKEIDCYSISDVAGKDFDGMDVSQLLDKDCMNVPHFSGKVSDGMGISQLSYKRSDCNSISDVPGKVSDGMGISQLSYKRSDCNSISDVPGTVSDGMGISQLSYKRSDCKSISDVPGTVSDGMGISQLSYKRSDCNSISDVPGKVSDGMGISQLSYKRSDYNSISDVPGKVSDGMGISQLSYKRSDYNSISDVPGTVSDGMGISQLSYKRSDCNSISDVPGTVSDGMGISQLSYKRSDCNSISDVPGKVSDGMGISQLSYKRSDYNSISDVPGKVSDGMGISQLSYKRSDCNSISDVPGKEPDDISISHLPEYDFSVLPDQHTNKKVPDRNIDICATELSPLQSNSKLTSYSSGECHEPVTHTSPAHILSQPCGSSSLSSLSNVRKAHCRRLPDSIDSEVFSSLPSNIRGEIMAHVVMGTLDSTCGQHRKFLAPDHKRNLKQTRDTKAKNQNSLLTYFKRDNTDPK